MPEIGTQSAYKANRAGVADRFAEPAVPKSIAVALALRPYDDQLLGNVALALGKAAKHHDAHPLYLLQTVPGSGTILSLVLLYDMHDMDRCPTGQDCVS